VGKSTIVRRVLDADPKVRFSVSHTTRAPRQGERHGVDYFFVKEAGIPPVDRRGGVPRVRGGIRTTSTARAAPPSISPPPRASI